LLANITSGRGSEVTEILFRNSKDVIRNVMILQGHMCYVTKYFKATRATNKSFYVARFLPPVVARLLYHYLVYIRPFSVMLAQELKMTIKDSNYLFCSTEKPYKPWKSTRLTEVLRDSSAKLFKTGITIQDYRHIVIAVTRRHVKSIAGRFNPMIDVSADVRSSVVYAWQAGHREMMNVINYGLDRTFPHKLQPELLMQYHRVSDTWHKWIGFEYQDVFGKRTETGLKRPQQIVENDSDDDDQPPTKRQRRKVP
jgi:hypothetical protein